MNNIIETYLSRKLDLLEKAKDEAIIAIKCTDTNYASLRDLKNTNTKCEGLISLGSFVFSDSIKASISEVRATLKADTTALITMCEEADALFDMASDYAEQVKTLTRYGILTKDGKINA